MGQDGSTVAIVEWESNRTRPDVPAFEETVPAFEETVRATVNTLH
ncbi:hypothetical protein GCM10010519_26240 [Streptomyces lactacystinicus]